MGYRDDFYKAENMIGYTGTLHEFPTVYFLTKKEYGHITQKHPHSQNVGRHGVGDATNGYKIGNQQFPTGEKRMVEKRGKKVMHTSRGVLTPTKYMGDGDKAILLQAIYKWPDEKQITNFNKETRKELADTAAQHAKVMAELLEKFELVITPEDVA
jgi:hypothetical protein